MDTTRLTQLSCLMLMAWSFRRAEPVRSFADCLRAAWRMAKQSAQEAARILAAAKAGGGQVRLSKSLIASPIRQASAGQRYGRARDFQAAYTSAVFGG